MYVCTFRHPHAGRGPKFHGTRGPCSEINQRKSNRKSNKSMEIKVIFSKISYGKPYSEPKNPKKFPLASLATHEEEFSAKNARFFCPKTPRTRFVLQKPCKMRQNEPRIQKISACGAPDMTSHARARIEKKSARNQNFGNQTLIFFYASIWMSVCRSNIFFY